MGRRHRAKGIAHSLKHLTRPALCALRSVLLFSALWPITSVAQPYKILGPGSCGLTQNNCHVEENNWWKSDAHKRSLDRFFDDAEACEKYAELSGVGAANMLKGSSSCMRCHGTATSGKEANEVEEGVSCESCHGPGSGYKDPHSEGARGLGVNRPGYIKGLQLGMVELKNLPTRAASCVRCHYITDQQLIRAGHSNGTKFNYVSGIRKVSGTPNHWKRAPNNDDLARAPFDNALKAKGGQVPSRSVVVAKTPTPPPATPPTIPGNAPDQSVTAPNSAAPTVEPPLQLRPRRPPPAPTPPPAPAVSTERVKLPPFPAISDSASVGEILLILQQRLKLLYRKTGN